MYWESPEKAQSHIHPLDVSPGLLLLMVNSVMREKLDVLQILQVWSAEQVANRLEIKTFRFYDYILQPKVSVFPLKHLNLILAFFFLGHFITRETHVESGLNLQRSEYRLCAGILVLGIS